MRKSAKADLRGPRKKERGHLRMTVQVWIGCSVSIVGIDIGGAVPDLVGLQDGAIVTAKPLTVPADPTEGAATALTLATCDVAAMDELLHGSTIAINTVLERSGARTALITTAGFRDIYALGRGN